jgi:mannose-1-phosphate guanylyltransferase
MGRFSAFVLAAGYGTRLRPLTDEIPKPILPVGGQPLLATTLRVLHEAGAEQLWVNVHHKHEQIANVINTLGFEVHVLVEDRILGTAGGLAQVRGLVGVPLVVVNGDIVTELPLDGLLGASGPGLTLAVAPARVTLGTVGLGDQGQVVRLRGETFGGESASADYIGVACVGHECLATLPDEGCLIGDWALPWLRAGGSIGTVGSTAPFLDLGDPHSYLQANLERLRGQNVVAPGVRVPEGIELESSVIGEQAQLSGSGVIRQSVILPRARATAPLDRCIVLPSGGVVEVR